MYRGKKIIAVIPARGGSKRLPRKNALPLMGKPLVAWSIDAALESRIFDEIMVNTDDTEIADIARQFGASVPFIRKTDLATDTASSIDVIIDTLANYKKIEIAFDILVLLQPTSPLRTGADIQRAVDFFIDKQANSVLSVCEVDHPVQWANTLDESLSMDNFIRDEHKGVRSQDLPAHYRLNGALYVWDVPELMKCHTSIISPSFAYKMPRERSIDIDEKLDFSIAESIWEDAKQLKDVVK